MLRIDDLHVYYQGDRGVVRAVKGVSFEVAQGDFFTLLGPSGCGKTTTLRSVAGLETPTSGRIAIGDTVVFDSARGIDIKTPKREIAMVFQSYAIWPHMSVFENVAFSLRHGRKKTPGAEIKPKVMNALSLVQLQDYADRPAPQLSGGQQQRVALARAVACEPQLLLLDEPLSNLDARLREEMRNELRELVTRLNMTALYVTHDQVEALSMSDRLIVMSDGVVIQEGAPADVYLHPNSEFSANFLGRANILRGTVRELESDQQGTVETAGGTLNCLIPQWAHSSRDVLITFRPEAVSLSRQPMDGINALRGEVVTVTFVGDAVEYVINVGDMEVRVKGDPFDTAAAGDPVWLRVPPVRCLVIADGANVPVAA
jgi:iron(III) transport system ATP-binding protein